MSKAKKPAAKAAKRAPSKGAKSAALAAQAPAAVARPVIVPHPTIPAGTHCRRKADGVRGAILGTDEADAGRLVCDFGAGAESMPAAAVERG